MPEITEMGRLSGSISGTAELAGKLAGLGQLSGRISASSAPGGTSDYERLRNKPSIETVVLSGDKTFEELGLSPIGADELLEILA